MSAPEQRDGRSVAPAPGSWLDIVTVHDPSLSDRSDGATSNILGPASSPLPRDPRTRAVARSARESRSPSNSRGVSKSRAASKARTIAPMPQDKMTKAVSTSSWLESSSNPPPERAATIRSAEMGFDWLKELDTAREAREGYKRVELEVGEFVWDPTPAGQKLAERQNRRTGNEQYRMTSVWPTIRNKSTDISAILGPGRLHRQAHCNDDLIDDITACLKSLGLKLEIVTNTYLEEEVKRLVRRITSTMPGAGRRTTACSMARVIHSLLSTETPTGYKKPSLTIQGSVATSHGSTM